MDRSRDYDVAFSYASQQRAYVDETYQALTSHGFHVYYDKEDATLGRDLYQHLSDVYQNKSRYCVLFLSKDYAEKAWTTHELKAVQARAFSESRDYILPGRFDDTEIPGLLPTIAYADLRQLSPAQFAERIADRIASDAAAAPSIRSVVPRGIESALSDAVVWAEQYLAPQSLDLSDEIAEAVRDAFRDDGLSPRREDIREYIISRRAQDRVVGYIALQVHPIPGMVLDLIVALRLEQAHALARVQTRPLWQLLVCMGRLMGDSGTSLKEAALMREALDDSLGFLEAHAQLDPGGQCKRRMRALIKEG